MMSIGAAASLLQASAQGAENTAAHGTGMEVPEFLFLLIAVLVGAKVLGELAERVGQPAVLGELLAGVLLGASVFGIVDPASEIVHLLAEVGVVVLLFQIGLETQLRKLMAVGGASAMVAVVGVVLPFVSGYAVAHWFGLGLLPAIVAGASLTATSVGITARVLSDLGRLQDDESQIVLGAAVIDDIIGLVILAVVAQLVAGGDVTPLGITMITLTAFGFVAAVLILGSYLIPPLFRLLAKIGKPDTVAIMGLAFAFVIAYLADAVDSALIVGAFAAGLVIAPTEHAHVVEDGIKGIARFFVPIFFVAVGAAVDVRTFLDPQVMMIGLALIVVAIIGKVVAGYAPFWIDAKKSVIGVGMIPRGEVGLIFAQMGLTSGVLSVGLFSAVTLMVMVTTFMAPPLLKMLFPPLGEPSGVSPTSVAELTTEA